MKQKNIDFLTVIMFIVCIIMTSFTEFRFTVLPMISFLFILFLIEKYNDWICKKILGTWNSLLKR